MDMEPSVCAPHDSGQVRCGATEASAGASSTGGRRSRRRAEQSPRSTPKIKAGTWEPVPPESSWRHIASQGVLKRLGSYGNLANLDYFRRSWVSRIITILKSSEAWLLLAILAPSLDGGSLAPTEYGRRPLPFAPWSPFRCENPRWARLVAPKRRSWSTRECSSRGVGARSQPIQTA